MGPVSLFMEVRIGFPALWRIRGAHTGRAGVSVSVEGGMACRMRDNDGFLPCVYKRCDVVCHGARKMLASRCVLMQKGGCGARTRCEM